MKKVNPRAARRAELAAMSDADLLAACVTAKEAARRERPTPENQHYLDDVWGACLDTKRDQLFLAALAEVIRRETETRASNGLNQEESMSENRTNAVMEAEVSTLPRVSRNPVPTGQGLTREQIDLIKRNIAVGASDDELALFVAQCNRTGLDPFSRQIYCIQRRAKKGGEWTTKMETQVSISGLQLIADRTERYVPGREPTYEYDAEGRLVAATSYVKKLAGGVWHEVAATARYEEFVQLTKDNQPNHFWARMPHVMLAKTAEAQALRRAFPMELSGLFIAEEMGAGGSQGTQPARPALPPPAQPLAMPTTGPELSGRLLSGEDQLVRWGWCAAGDLIDHVRRGLVMVKALEVGDEIADCPEEAIPLALRLAKEFRQAHDPSNRPPAPAPVAPAPHATPAPTGDEALATPEQLADLSTLMDRKDCSWRKVALGCKWANGTMRGTLTQGQYRQAVAALAEEPDAP